MAAVSGVASISNASTASYQVKQTPQVNSVEAVNESAAQNAGSDIASQVVTVQEKDSNNNRENSKDEQSEATNEQIKRAVEDLNKKMKHTSCEFGIHESTNRVTIKIVDNDTKEVIKEFPPEETLDMIAKVWEVAGLMVDEKL
ncbi:MAG: flagellar protein FlaG [Lachnospiraceae bacterium]|nr:flagellar protein FlaG [Lachnospiraceae bacterium]